MNTFLMTRIRNFFFDIMVVAGVAAGVLAVAGAAVALALKKKRQ